MGDGYHLGQDTRSQEPWRAEEEENVISLAGKVLKGVPKRTKTAGSITCNRRALVITTNGNAYLLEISLFRFKIATTARMQIMGFLLLHFHI